MTQCSFCAIKIPINPEHLYENARPYGRYLLCNSCAEVIEQALEAQIKRAKKPDDADE